MSALIEASPKDARHHTIKAIAPEMLPEHRDATRSPFDRDVVTRARHRRQAVAATI
jgi:hypothetical protein